MTTNNAKLKVLVFDDTEKHRKAAETQLKDHDVTIVSSYDDAQQALKSVLDYDKAKVLFGEKYGDSDPYRSEGISKEKRDERMGYYKECQERATTHPDFDAVLTDLLVPASRQAQGGEGMAFVGKEMPLGSIIALLALTAGVKKVAVVTDMNHHNHPASAALDCFRGNKCSGANIVCTNNCTTQVDEQTFEPVTHEFMGSPEGKSKYPDGPNYSRKGVIWVKNWAGVLGQLLDGSDDSEGF